MVKSAVCTKFNEWIKTHNNKKNKQILLYSSFVVLVTKYYMNGKNRFHFKINNIIVLLNWGIIYFY